jgi:hypothetical protein
MEAVIPEVNKFAHKVNAKIFGRPYADAEYAVIPNRYARPYDSTVSPLNPYFGKYRRARIRDRSLWKSKTFKVELRGMAMGDVNGDGKNEMVLLEGIDIAVYSFQKAEKQGALLQLARHESLDNERYLSVDVADINGNGRAEIFASKVRETTVTSEVLEMDKGGRLRPVAKRSPWLFRVTTLPERGEVLLGQRITPEIIGQGTMEPDLTKQYFDPAIYLLQWKDSGYRKAEEKPLFNVKGIYVFNFAMTDLGGDPGPEIVMIDQNDKLRILDGEGNELHKTAENFGGTINYVVANPRRKSRHGELAQRHIYIPARIVTADLDQDGQNEIIINRNKSETYGLTERFKAFSDGHLVSLTWTGLSLETIWESRKLSGCLADYQVKDLDNDGKLDLAVALIQKRKVAGLSEARSVVMSYNLRMKEEEEKEKK